MKDKYCFRRMAAVMVCLILCVFYVSAAAGIGKTASAASAPPVSDVDVFEVSDEEEAEVELEDAKIPLAIGGMTSDAGRISPILVASVMAGPILLALPVVRLAKLKREL